MRQVCEYPHPEPSLYRALKKVPVSTLSRIHDERVTGKKTKLSREVLVWELIHKFHGLETPLEKRENERMNLSEIDDLSEMLQFTKLCDITIPNDIIMIIFSYIPRNLAMIMKVGSVSQHFYLSFLSSWPHVTITKRNCYKIPILVLENIRSISFPDKKILHGDLLYIWSKVKSEKLRKIHAIPQNATKAFNSLKKYKKANSLEFHSLPTKNVTQLSFDREEYICYSSYYSFKFDENLFPSLRTMLHFPPNRKISEDTKIRELGFDGLPEALPEAKFESVRVLEINDMKISDTRDQSRLLKRFPNTQQLRLEYQSPRHYYQVSNSATTTTRRVFDLSMFSSLTYLQKLEIRMKQDQSSYSSMYSSILGYGQSKEKIPVSVEYGGLIKNSSIEELDIDGGESNARKLNLEMIDFNLEDIVDSGLLSLSSFNIKDNNNKLKRFRARNLLLFSRKWVWENPKNERNDNPQIFRRSEETPAEPKNIFWGKMANVVLSFVDFMESRMAQRFEIFDLGIRIPMFWRSGSKKEIREKIEESFSIRYDRRSRKMGLRYGKNMINQDGWSFWTHFGRTTPLPRKEKSPVEFLVLKNEGDRYVELEKYLRCVRMPGLAFLCCVVKVIRKMDLSVCTLDLSSVESVGERKSICDHLEVQAKENNLSIVTKSENRLVSFL